MPYILSPATLQDHDWHPVYEDDSRSNRRSSDNERTFFSMENNSRHRAESVWHGAASSATMRFITVRCRSLHCLWLTLDFPQNKRHDAFALWLCVTRSWVYDSAALPAYTSVRIRTAELSEMTGTAAGNRPQCKKALEKVLTKSNKLLLNFNSGFKPANFSS